MIIYFSRYETYKTDERSNSGGIAYIVHNRIDFDILHLEKGIHGFIEKIGITLKNVSRRANIVAVYYKPGWIVEKRTWSKILKVKPNRSDTLFIGDFNAHNTLWNCENTDINGDR
ncbi:hypothetical protein P5V15_002851 [Pogonomyrmex californicus]